MPSMTFLELVQRAHQESAISGSPPSSVLNQSGCAADMVRWVLSAHEEIQLQNTDWTFDWARGSFTLSAGDDSYDPTADFGVTGGVRDFDRKGCYLYDTALGDSTRLWLDYKDWDIFRELIVPAVGGMPVCFSQDPAGNARFYPRPDKTYTAVMEYMRNPQVMTANTDVPRIPAKFHMAIVWRAVMMCADWIKDWSLKDTANEKYSALMDRMEFECRPRTLGPGPLA